MKTGPKTMLIYAGVFLAAPFVIGAITVASRFRLTDITPPIPYAGELHAPPMRDPGKLDAVVIAGNAGTEGSDFLVPFELLHLSGAFNVYAATPERRISALTPESVDIIADASLAGVTAILEGKRPDLIVIPYLPKARDEDRAVLEWIRANVGDQTVVLAICGGSEVLALTGLLDGRRATSHHTMLAGLGAEFPAVEWVSGQRYVEDGLFVTSGAVLAGFDATLHVIRRMVGEDVARRIAAELEYPHARFLDDPSYAPPEISFVGAGLNIAYRWWVAPVGLEVKDGMDELELTAAIDTYPHTYALRLISFAQERRIHRTRHGLAVVPRRGGVDASSFSWSLAPRSNGSGDGRYAVETSLADIATRYGGRVAAPIAWGLGYPVSDETLAAGASWPVDPTVRPLLIGLMAVAALAIARRKRWAGRRPPLGTVAGRRAQKPTSDKDSRFGTTPAFPGMR